jgi:hypothetical protein
MAMHYQQIEMSYTRNLPSLESRLMLKLSLCL